MSPRPPHRRAAGEAPSLFDPPAAPAAPASRPPAGPPDTWTVHDLNDAIATSLAERFPRAVWVRGEIAGLARRGGGRHMYFELVEKERRGAKVKAALPVALLEWNRQGVDAALAASGGLSLADGIEIRICGRVEFYRPYGKVQFAMTGIDPEFTLGKIAQQRDEVLRRLQAADLLDRNGRIPFPRAPLRVGLVTSTGSAAYRDFLHGLEASDFGFHVDVMDVRVQGGDAERTVVGGLKAIAARDPDVVVLIRGGGSRSDLAAFDSEWMARTIAQMTVPVVTGIGHEIDTAVADEVAHTACKTPTACADLLVRAVTETMERADLAWASIGLQARRRPETARATLTATARQLRKAVSGSLARSESHLAATAGRVRAGRHVLRDASRDLVHSASVLERASAAGTARAEVRTDTAAARLRVVPERGALVRRLAVVDAAAVRIDAADPAHVLARGYSITHTADGALVRAPTEVTAGARLVTTTAHGPVHSEVVPGPEPDEAST